MKRYSFFLSAVVCASASIAQVPDTSPQDLSGANTPTTGTTGTAGAHPTTRTQTPPMIMQAPPVHAAGIPSSSDAPSSAPSDSSAPSASSASGQGDGTNASVAADSPSIDGGGSSRPAGGYLLGGGNVFSANTEGAQSSGMPATSNSDASSGAPPANPAAAASRSAGESRTASSTNASGQEASVGNAARPRPNAEDCRAYARHRGDAAQTGGQAASSANPAADPCAGLDQGAAR